ncbi:MAG: MATE family efflux transporter [Eubacteriales bacterium]|nr:MATE family efflux transporter [Eubacteriales bacterium]
MERENKMGTMPVGKLIINMSLPMVISMLVQALYNVVDSVFVSRISEQALTAVSLAFPAQNLMIGVATGTGVGVNALLSRALGEKNRGRVSKVAENGVFLALVGYALFLVFGLFGSRVFMASQTQVSEIIEMGTEYLTVCCGLSFGIFGEIMFERLMQSTGRTFYTMITQGVGAIFNIIFDPIFIFTLDMGVTGAALATVLGQIVALVLAIVLNHKHNPDVRLSVKGFRPDLRMIGEIYAIGVPSIIMVCIGSVMTFLMNKILILYTAGKETAATVFGVYFKLNSFIFMPIFGLNNGIIPIVAYNYGAKNRARMIQAVKIAAVIACSVMFVGMLLFLTIPGTLLSLFDASETMLAIGEPALRIISTSFTFAGVCIVLGSIFQALGHSVYSMIVSFIRQLVVLVPCAYLLARVGQRVGNDNLVWLSYPIAEVFSLAVTLILFTKLYRNVIMKVPLHGEENEPANF